MTVLVETLPFAPVVFPRLQYLKTTLALLLVFNLLDGVFTLISVLAGVAVEANPLMDQLLEVGPVAFMVGKVLIVSLGIGLLWRLRQRKFALIGSVGTCVVYFFVCVWHLQGLRYL